ncbi:Crp/Fnr family transcriptional regulator [Sphingopyxis sp.]|uniref:Crp/Fnr family transcriptional regulator n=1 Tax=Sphingopyxis sp. TaxID=1908224 RepID=UPI002D7FBD9E|nr:Crp/Fnr family transcriptional regulator [Sphingopyxis sp.]
MHETLGDDDRWLSLLPQETRDFIRARVRLRHFADRARVYAVGDEADGLYQIVSGEVRLMAYPAVGRQLLTLVARRRHWFGELSVVDRGPRPHDAICQGPVALLHLPLRDIDAFAKTDAGIYGHVALIGCAHQRAALSYIGSMLAKPSRARLAEMILNMASREAGFDHPVLQISQEDLAGRVGMSRQHLGNLLSDLKAAGCIATSYGRIHILDQAALAAMAD